jgi:REP element-mobilizing transposase RayT
LQEVRTFKRSIGRNRRFSGLLSSERLLALGRAMARPLRLHLPGVACHVFARGNAKQCIFVDDIDYREFLGRLARALDRFAVDCLSYCLLWNHYHLLLVPREQPVSRVLQNLNSAYCRWFNRRHGRVGHVLQGRYGSRLIDDASYMLAVLRYIALNPVEAGQAARPEDWRWSSYQSLIGLEKIPTFLAADKVWRAVNADDEIRGRQRLLEFVSAGDSGREVLTALLYGGEKLARTVEPMLIPFRRIPDFVYAERFATRPALDEIFQGAVTPEQRQDAARLAFSRYGYTLREIGTIVQRTAGTVWLWTRRSEARAGGPPPCEVGPMTSESLVPARHADGPACDPGVLTAQPHQRIEI